MPDIEQYTVQNVRVTFSRFDFAPTALPDVPTIEGVSDRYVLMATGGALLPGTLGERPERCSLINARPSELLRGIKPITPQFAGLIDALLAQVVAALPTHVTLIEAKELSGVIVRLDRITLDGNAQLVPAFTPDGAPDLPALMLTVPYTLTDATEQQRHTGTVSLPIGPTGWNLDLALAAQALGYKVAEIRAEEGVR